MIKVVKQIYIFVHIILCIGLTLNRMLATITYIWQKVIRIATMRCHFKSCNLNILYILSRIG